MPRKAQIGIKVCCQIGNHGADARFPTQSKAIGVWTPHQHRPSA